MVSNIDISRLLDLPSALVATDYTVMRRGGSDYRCSASYITSPGYVSKNSGESPDLNKVSVYASGSAVGAVPNPTVAGDWFTHILLNPDGTTAYERRYVSRDGVSFVHVQEENWRYVVKNSTESPEILRTSVYPVGATVGPAPTIGQVGDWYEVIVLDAGGASGTRETFTSRDGASWARIQLSDLGSPFELLTLADSPITVGWDRRYVLDLAGTNPANRLDITVSGVPTASEAGSIELKSLPDATWAGGYLRLRFNDGLGAPITARVDNGSATDGDILISDRAVNGSAFHYVSNVNQVFGYALSLSGTSAAAGTPVTLAANNDNLSLQISGQELHFRDLALAQMPSIVGATPDELIDVKPQVNPVESGRFYFDAGANAFVKLDGA